MTKFCSVFALLLVLAGCAGKAPVYVIGDVGAKLTPISLEAHQTVLAAEKSGLNTDYIAKAEVQFRTLGETLQKLAAALDAYRLVGPAQQPAEGEKLLTLIHEARRVMRTIMVFTGGNEALAEQLNRSFDNMERLFDVITTGLAPIPAPAQ